MFFNSCYVSFKIAPRIVVSGSIMVIVKIKSFLPHPKALL